MEVKQSIKKNFIYSTLYQILIIVAPLITAPYTSRIFGADGVGIHSYTNSIVAYFTLFAALGTASYGQRTIARNRDNKEEASKLFWEIELLSVFTTAISLVAWVIFVISSTQYTSYYVVLTMTLIATAFDISWFFGGYEQFKYVFIRNAAVRLIGIIVLFTLVKEKDDLLLYVALLAATGLLGNISMWTYLPRFLVKVNWKELKVFRHLRETLVYFIPTIATSIYNVADKTMLGIITNDTYENGYYEQANKIASMAKTLLFSLNTVMTSRMSYLFVKGKQNEFSSMLHKSMNAILFFAIPLFWGISSIAAPFVPLFFGEGYDKVIILMPLCNVMIIIIGISNCLERQYYTPSGKKRLSNRFVIIGACINFCLNLILIPFLESVGATIASVIAESIITLMYLYYARNEISFADIIKMSYKYFIAGAIMFGAVQISIRLLPGGWVSLFIDIAIGAIVYFVALLVFRDSFFYECLRLYLVPIIKKIKK